MAELIEIEDSEYRNQHSRCPNMRCHRTVLVMMKRLLPSTSPVDTARELAPPVLVYSWSNHFMVLMLLFAARCRASIATTALSSSDETPPVPSPKMAWRQIRPPRPWFEPRPRALPRSRRPRDCSINEDQKLDLEIGESNFTNGSISSDSTVGHN